MRRLFAYPVILLAGLAGAGVVAVMTQQSASVAIENGTIDLGVVSDKAPAFAELTISNNGNDSVGIRQITSSCGCIAVDVRNAPVRLPLVVLAKSSTTIPFRLHTNSRVGRQNAKVAILVDKGDALIASISWTVAPRAFAIPAAIQLESPLGEGAADAQFKIVSPNRLTPFVPRRVTCSGSSYVCANVIPTFAGGNSVAGSQRQYDVRVELTFPPSLSANEINASVTVYPSDDSLEPLTVPVHCDVRRPISTIPRLPVVLFDDRDNEATYSFVCRLAAELKDERVIVESSSPSIIVSTSPLQGSLDRTVTIRFTPPQHQNQNRVNLRFRAGEFDLDCPILIPDRFAAL